MSVNSERAALSLHNMIREMQRKNIELSRIVKCSTQLIMSGATPNSIPRSILNSLIDSQNKDGGFVSNADTIWNIKFLKYYPEFAEEKNKAIKWLLKQQKDGCFGRSKRDMVRIPVTGLAYYLLPELCSKSDRLSCLEKLWKSEINSLTYKASYTLMAFKANEYIPKDNDLIIESIKWLEKQQEIDGGFAPWKGHPVGANIYCTAVSCLGLLSYHEYCSMNTIERAYKFMIETQLKNGLWAYHELEDGAAWGLRAMIEIEKERG